MAQLHRRQDRREVEAEGPQGGLLRGVDQDRPPGQPPLLEPAVDLRGAIGLVEVEVGEVEVGGELPKGVDVLLAGRHAPSREEQRAIDQRHRPLAAHHVDPPLAAELDPVAAAPLDLHPYRVEPEVRRVDLHHHLGPPVGRRARHEPIPHEEASVAAEAPGHPEARGELDPLPGAGEAIAAHATDQPVQPRVPAPAVEHGRERGRGGLDRGLDRRGRTLPAVEPAQEPRRRPADALAEIGGSLAIRHHLTVPQEPAAVSDRLPEAG